MHETEGGEETSFLQLSEVARGRSHPGRLRHSPGVDNPRRHAAAGRGAKQGQLEAIPHALEGQGQDAVRLL